MLSFIFTALAICALIDEHLSLCLDFNLVPEIHKSNEKTLGEIYCSFENHLKR
jgi:hypothetical protein